MIPGLIGYHLARVSIPRESGDDPYLGVPDWSVDVYSPRERG